MALLAEAARRARPGMTAQEIQNFLAALQSGGLAPGSFASPGDMDLFRVDPETVAEVEELFAEVQKGRV
jgi:hypothetical protein